MTFPYGDQILSKVYKINMKKSTIILGILMIVALVGGLILVNQSQETRRGATFANTKLFLLPETKIEKNVDEEFGVQVWYTTQSGAKVDGVQANLCADNNVVMSETKVDVNEEAGFGDETVVLTKDGCTTVVVKSSQDVSKLKGNAKAFTVYFKGKSVGEGNIRINKDKSAVTGDNPASPTDKSLAITEVAGTTYKISGGTIETSGPEIKFKMTYAGVVEGTKCAVNWPVKAVLLSGTTKKEISGIKTVRTEEKVNGLVVYEGSFRIGDFASEKLALFIKGPKHLQMKYSVDGQDKPYGKAGGEIAAGTGKVYDFTNYPALAGDVNVDGWINGQDFSIVKAKSEKYVEVAEGGNHEQDLDGSCQVNQRDLTLLVNSLDKKQEELY